MAHEEGDPTGDERARGGDGAAPRPGWLRTGALFVILSGFWLLLSGRIGLQYFAMMAMAVGIVLVLNPARPFGPDAHGRSIRAVDHLRGIWHTLRFVAWLLYNIVKANVEVAVLVLHPRLPIDPGLLRFRVRMPSEIAHVLMANSITLTPGTITIDVRDGEFLVHALVPRSAANVLGGELQAMTAPIFRDEPEGGPDHRWSYSVEHVAIPSGPDSPEAESGEGDRAP